MNEWKEIAATDMSGNVFERIGSQWMLVSAGDERTRNTMTASWGGLGVLWNKPVATAYIRPTRHTFGLMEREDTFSLSFLPESYREALRLCGKLSGRDGDKFAAAELTPAFADGTPYVAQAELVLVCRKLYRQDIDPICFLDDSIQKNYQKHDYHRMYIGEIEKVLTR